MKLCAFLRTNSSRINVKPVPEPVLIFSLSYTVLHHILDLTHLIGVQYYLYNMNYVLYYSKEIVVYFASEH